MIEQAKFIYSPLRKALEKQAKTIEDQWEKQIKALEEHLKQFFESNELIKKGFNTKIAYHLENRINPDNLICKYKTEGISPKDFRNYQDPIRFFKYLTLIRLSFLKVVFLGGGESIWPPPPPNSPSPPLPLSRRTYLISI